MKPEKMIVVKQNPKYKMCLCVKTIEWLVRNTSVNKFVINKDGVSGYQREINPEHVKKIIDYIENNDFYFPSSIVCSMPESGGDENQLNKLFVVDGQHRVESFRELKKINREKYDKIKDMEVPVTILKDVSLETEINTFITINKTSRRVDTSLAYILRNQLSKTYTDKNSAKIDYLAVELAQKVCFESENSLWNNRIAFDGETKNNYHFLSLNSFVKAERRIIRKLALLKLISLDLKDKKEIAKILSCLVEVFDHIWDCVQKKWPELFKSDKIYDSIITGPIGFTTINKFIALKIDSHKKNEVLDQIKKYISNLNISSSKWMKGGSFSKLSSEAGYSEIVAILNSHCK